MRVALNFTVVNLGYLQVLEQVGFEITNGGEWKFWKYVEEAKFGPGLPVHTVFIMGKLLAGDRNLLGLCVYIYALLIFF